jgi:hypothetical protein
LLVLAWSLRMMTTFAARLSPDAGLAHTVVVVAVVMLVFVRDGLVAPLATVRSTHETCTSTAPDEPVTT